MNKEYVTEEELVWFMIGMRSYILKNLLFFLNGLSNHRSQQRDLESRIRTCD
jgi:hypothetical protein